MFISFYIEKLLMTHDPVFQNLYKSFLNISDKTQNCVLVERDQKRSQKKVFVWKPGKLFCQLYNYNQLYFNL